MKHYIVFITTNMAEIRILLIGFCIYGIVYCVYVVKAVLVHREVQLSRFKKVENDVVKLNKLYLHFIRKCEQTPKNNITLKEIITELKRLKCKINNK